jgi:hypothetical protein
MRKYIAVQEIKNYLVPRTIWQLQITRMYTVGHASYIVHAAEERRRTYAIWFWAGDKGCSPFDIVDGNSSFTFSNITLLTPRVPPAPPCQDVPVSHDMGVNPPHFSPPRYPRLTSACGLYFATVVILLSALLLIYRMAHCQSILAFPVLCKMEHWSILAFPSECLANGTRFQAISQSHLTVVLCLVYHIYRIPHTSIPPLRGGLLLGQRNKGNTINNPDSIL